VKRYIVDTNGLLSFITDRNPGQQEKIAVYFNDAAVLKCELIIIENVITEFVYVLQKVYRVPDLRIREIIINLIMTPGIVIENSFNPAKILDLWPEIISDYGDAVIADHARALKVPVLSFDRDLQRRLKRLNIRTHI